MNIITIIWKMFQSTFYHLDKDKGEPWQELIGTRFYYEMLAGSSFVYAMLSVPTS